MGRRLLALALATALVALAGCGGDDEPAPSAGGGASPEDQAPKPGQTAPKPPSGPPSEVPGTKAKPPSGARRTPRLPKKGSGGVVNASAPAAIEGRRGRLSPRRVEVPPFIVVNVSLRSSDGRRYSLAGAGKRLVVGGKVSSVTERFRGLRPGSDLRLSGPQGSVVIAPSAEPGP